MVASGEEAGGLRPDAAGTLGLRAGIPVAAGAADTAAALLATGLTDPAQVQLSVGTGTIDFDQFFGALRGIDYQGIVTFESFSSAVVSPTLSNTLAVWRNLWDDGEDLARAARRFMLEGLGDAAPAERVP